MYWNCVIMYTWRKKTGRNIPAYIWVLASLMISVFSVLLFLLPKFSTMYIYCCLSQDFLQKAELKTWGQVVYFGMWVIPGTRVGEWGDGSRVWRDADAVRSVTVIGKWGSGPLWPSEEPWRMVFRTLPTHLSPCKDLFTNSHPLSDKMPPGCELPHSRLLQQSLWAGFCRYLGSQPQEPCDRKQEVPGRVDGVLAEDRFAKPGAVGHTLGS